MTSKRRRVGGVRSVNFPSLSMAYIKLGMHESVNLLNSQLKVWNGGHGKNP